MYRRILLAYDGSLEGRTALREGALLARRCNAAVFLLSVDVGASAVKVAEGACAGAVDHHHQQVTGVLAEGVEALKRIGFSPVARLVEGDPAQQIKLFAEEIQADLVVVGHRRRSLFARWWSGSSGAVLSEQLGCSLLIARSDLTREDLEAELSAA